MEVYFAFLGSLVLLSCGLWMLISPRSFLKVYTLQLRGLVDVERWTHPGLFVSLLYRFAGFGLAVAGYILLSVTSSAIYGTAQTRPAAEAAEVALRTDGSWAVLLSGVAITAIGVFAAVLPDTFVRLICRYLLMLGEPTPEGTRRLRAFARVMAAVAIAGGGWIVVGALTRIIS